jgi:hypothetical protein
MALVKDTLLQSTEDMTGRWYHSMTDLYRLRRSVERCPRTGAEDGALDQLS